MNVEEFYLINVGEFHLMRRKQFPVWKEGIFRSGKEIEGLRGGVPMYRLAERRESCRTTAAGSGDLGWRSHRPGRKRTLSGRKLVLALF